MKRVIKESDIRKIVANALRESLGENFTDEYRTKGALNKKTLEKAQGEPSPAPTSEPDDERNPDWDESMEDVLAKFQGPEEYDDTTAGGEYKIDKYDPYFFDKEGQKVNADAIGNFHNDFAIVKKDGKVNYINNEGRILSDEWFDSCNDFEDGFGLVSKDRKRNFVRSDGNLLLDQWVDRAGDFLGGTAPIMINGERHSVDRNGNIK